MHLLFRSFAGSRRKELIRISDASNPDIAAPGQVRNPQRCKFCSRELEFVALQGLGQCGVDDLRALKCLLPANLLPLQPEGYIPHVAHDLQAAVQHLDSAMSVRCNNYGFPFSSQRLR